MRLTSLIAVPLAALGGLASHAANGRIPIYAPITITQPGSYVVTANLSGPPPLIRVQANDVEIDLNGFQLQATTNAAPVIDASNLQALRVHGGSLVNGLNGVRMQNMLGGEVRRVFISGTASDGIRIDASTNVLVQENTISAGGIGIHLPAGAVAMQANVIGNLVSDTTGSGIRVTGLKAGKISGNHLRGLGDIGIQLLASSGFEVSDNTVLSAVLNGIAVVNSDGGQLRGNLVRLAGRNGIQLDEASDGILVLENTVSGSAEDGIHVQGRRCQIEGNHISTSTFRALHLTASSDRCVYRTNAGRGGGGLGAACAAAGSTNDFCNEGTQNSSEGENYLPSRL